MDREKYCNEEHVMPADEQWHESNEDCLCSPACEPVVRDDGSTAWLYIHRQLSKASDG